jgi:HSP20 family molecular chaperone IbpA
VREPVPITCQEVAVNRPEEELDVQPMDDGWQIVVPLPGITPDDLKIEVGDTELHIQTLDTSSSQASGFRYRLALPADVATEAVRTTLVDGQLTVTLPRRTPLPPTPPDTPPEPSSLT